MILRISFDGKDVSKGRIYIGDTVSVKIPIAIDGTIVYTPELVITLMEDKKETKKCKP